MVSSIPARPSFIAREYLEPLRRAKGGRARAGLHPLSVAQAASIAPRHGPRRVKTGPTSAEETANGGCRASSSGLDSSCRNGGRGSHEHRLRRVGTTSKHFFGKWGALFFRPKQLKQVEVAPFVNLLEASIASGVDHGIAPHRPETLPGFT